MNIVLNLALLLFAFLSIEQNGLAGRSLIKNSLLTDGLNGWQIGSHEIDVYVLKERLENNLQNYNREKSLLTVKMRDRSESSLVRVKADHSVAALTNLHYFMKVGFANAGEARFVVDVLDPDGESVWQESYTFDDESLYYDLRPSMAIVAKKAGIYTLEVRAQSSSDYGPCFFYYVQLGTSASEIAIEFPKKFPPGFNGLGRGLMVGKTYTLNLQSNLDFLSLERAGSSLQLNSKPGASHEYHFELKEAGFNVYQIRSIDSKRCLEFESRTKSVKAVACTKRQRQNWAIEPAKQGSYYIRPQNSENCLEVLENQLRVLHPIDGCEFQKFRFVVQG